MAARNNADLHAAIFACHGRAFIRTPAAFVAEAAPPPLFAHLVTTDPGTDPAPGIAALRTRFGGIAVKDSFARLDAAACGLRPLFEAQWIAHPPPRAASYAWHRVTDSATLARWTAAGGPDLPTTALSHPDLAIMARLEDDRIVAGCLLNRSPDCTGLSNVFGPAASSTWGGAARAAAAIVPDLPVVGYERDADLDHARAAGFAPLGALRVLVSA
ncbi:hypothetical protein ACK8OR_09175 [Jannaschia sp. KMU-145]|uniref:hypothetical protein n=1 Tax=Jannaschia halovivens TaxID=3388667 RepID=UPI00396AFAD7